MSQRNEELQIPRLSLEDEEMQTQEMISPHGEEAFGYTRIQNSSQNASMTSIDTMSTFDMDDPAQERGKMDVRVKTSAVLRSNSIQGSQMKAYEMNKVPRGYALVIDIEVYENDIHERRHGSHVDVENLKALLEQLGFTVQVCKDLSQANFYKELSEFASSKLHKEANMAVVGILSHGKDGIVYAADGQSIDMEYIYEYFNNKNCPALQGKPKFFIVQACRGDRNDQGVDSSDQLPPDLKRKRKAMSDKVQDATDRGTCSRARPTWEDMIIAYSTIPGYASLRDHYNGTWFIQSLVEVFSEHSHNTELIDLLRMTSARLSEFENEQGEKQTCNIEMRHLYKRIYFNPGLGRHASSSSPPMMLERPSASFGPGGQLDLMGSGSFKVPGAPAGGPSPLTRSKSTPPTIRKLNKDQQWFVGHKKENMIFNYNLPTFSSGFCDKENLYKKSSKSSEEIYNTSSSKETESSYKLTNSYHFVLPALANDLQHADPGGVNQNQEDTRPGSAIGFVGRITKVTKLKFTRLRRQNGFREKFRKYRVVRTKRAQQF